MAKWRLGTVPYLNADPLTCAFTDPGSGLAERVTLAALVPAELLPELLAGRIDAALVSTAGVLPEPDIRLLPGMGICSRGSVQSIQLYHHRPLTGVRSVALDSSSRSAVVLAQVLLRERWGVQPAIEVQPPNLPAMLAAHDAALLIGNPALQANEALRSECWDGPPPRGCDLGAEWDALTGLPFVYAAWAVRAESDRAELADLLREARDWGLERREVLAARGAARLGVPEATCRRYLTESIRYDLGSEELAGLERFRQSAVAAGLLPPGSAVRLAAGSL